MNDHKEETNSNTSTANESTGGEDSNQSQKKLNLFQSILMNDSDSLNELLDERTNKYILRLRNRDALSRTPLYYASQLGKTDIVHRLINTGACNMEDADADGWTCLFVACLYGNKDIVELLLKNEAKTEAREKRYGWTPIFAATCKNHVDIVKMLLQEGADVHVKDNTGRTPLWIAVMLEHTEIIHELIKHGASINCTDDKGRTPAYIAVQMEKKGALTILLNHNADLDIADQDGRNPLILAYKLRLIDIHEILIEGGADRSALEKEKLEEEENKFGPCKGNLEKTVKTAPAKTHCLTSTSTHVWGGTTDGTIFVWELNGDWLVQAEKLFNPSASQYGILDMIAVDDEVWVLTGTKEINILKVNTKYIASLRKKPEISDKKCVEIVKTISIDDGEIGCLTKFEDKIYGGSTFMNNTLTIYSWATKQPYLPKKDTLQVHGNEQFSKLCNNELNTKMFFSKDNLFMAYNRFVFVFSAKHLHQYQGVLDEHKNRITAMVEAMGKLWTGSRDASIRLWEIVGDRRVCLGCLENAHDEQVNSLAVAGNLQVISGGSDGKIRSRSAKASKLTRENEREFSTAHENDVECILWVPKTKNLWVASLDRNITIWT